MILEPLNSQTGLQQRSDAPANRTSQDSALSRAANSQRMAQARDVNQLAGDIRARMTEYRMKIAADQVNRAIANDESKRVVSSLNGKFSLISKIQQSLG